MSATSSISKKQFEAIGDSLLVRAPAKINLSLLIADKRPDGFHNLETIMAKINFYDELTFTPSSTDGIELICTGPHWAPSGSDNLIYRAAELFFEKTGKTAKIKIILNKNIPAASGLGGASSDAAATLLALNKLSGDPLNTDQFSSLAAVLGSDVPFFLSGPMAFCSGRGEKIRKIDKNFYFSALLILPNVTSSTKEVYDNHQVDLGLFKSLSLQIKAFLDQNRLDLIHNMCANMLENACFKVNNELADIRAKAEGICVSPVCLSGSGSSMFSVFTDTDYRNAEITQRRIKDDLGCECIVVSYNQW
ncbi:MAG: 4-(cytidine 5'-diphospho)-2-C-methyl-D-erythritol kinase [Anaerohalosphaeraceae bacterium]|nr:4-(cytidine 5'-diphospho)-2-C-methyl-D-erythritol kinase [Anaerohalosphaeraceae bacterium]